ncbi:BMP family lipoprotein [Pararhodobacter oceanensis]|uniref:BMP family ABC transporter substrate-binding protein n=1 Tax=Pararhodobacter oceanensis TaxID=2172121 RepID=A0A2T8HUQ0_9RHOB|nr:BMP family ABC transporter substrate-binding protein [Pararhodobacter oceanensis]PVH29126.1 BMP family ABC transporter substrate-binding protein [Pararhodobacter oceanensis]
MKLTRKFLGATAVLALTTGAALADPALIYDMGGKFDRSFNEMAFTGATRWAEETGGEFRDIELQSEAQREQAIRRFAESGYNPVVMTGFSMATPLEVVAADYPDTTFVIIDGVVDLPNVRSVIFSEQEGSYLVGLLAGMATETDNVSFVGGMDVPLIRAFACGYAQGAVAANEEVNVIVNYTGTTPAAWNDPVRGSEITAAQISQGSDVVFAAAGGTGVGVLQRAVDDGILSIGVDSNQNYLHPGQVLTSMMKRVDNAVYSAFESGPGMETGLHVMDLAAGGVGWADDEHNAELISDEMRAAVSSAQEAIAAGELAVHDYRSDSSCPISVE